MDRYIEKDGKKLRLGYTTGTCAAAAAKAAAWMLLSGRRKDHIHIETPKGIKLGLFVRDIQMHSQTVSCAVRKDSGDDPDVTEGADVYATVSFSNTSDITIDGGCGVGRVTKRGLEQPVGAAAINSTPRRMIRENVQEVCRLYDYAGGLSVIISVPDGEKLAKKTFNPRLGIVGGISILGTTGIVEPMSEQALVDTIRIELRQKRETGTEYILLTPGNYGADYIRESLHIAPDRAVLTSNFIGESLDICNRLSFKGVLLVGHVGKLVKLAGGMLNTHSKYGDCRMEILASHAAAAGLDSTHTAEILNCVTCDDAIRILKENHIYQETFCRITAKIECVMQKRADVKAAVGAILFSKVHGFLCETKNAQAVLNHIMEE